MTVPTATGSTLATFAAASGLAAIGIEFQPLFWAVVGATIGMSFAGPATKLRAIGVFMAVALCCSLFGSYMAIRLAEGDNTARNAFSCILAIGFHPIINAAITRLPAFLDGVMRRLGVGGGNGGNP